MNRILFNIYRVLVPKPLRTRITKKSLLQKIPAFFSKLPPEKVNDEQREVLEYLKTNQVATFPYPFASDYNPSVIEVFNDDVSGLKYVLLNDKKLYFKRRWNEKRIKKGFSDLLREQDEKSPHRYLTGDFDVRENDVILDIGAAEGNFSLSVVEKVKKIYLFEYNVEWIEALNSTFEPWKDKVEIIPMKVADFDDDSHIRLDTFLKDKEEVTFIKIDVDGAEKEVLKSSHEILKKGIPLRIALCTYHRNNDEIDFTRLMTDYGFKVQPSYGYMIHYYDKQMTQPYLRRGLIRCTRT